MPVQIYVGRGPKGCPMPPNYSHEMLATVDIIKHIWKAFNHHRPYYALVANLNEPSADLMLISEQGIGVMELKHYFGRIHCHDNGTWYAGPKRIQAGVPGRGFKNPHEQVQVYAEEVRDRLIYPPLWQEPWLPGKTIEWPEFKFHTAACFTHPDANISQFEEDLRKHCRPITLPWEDFSVLKVEDVTEWAASLRFEVSGDRTRGFTRHRLTPSQITRIVVELFDFFPWIEIYELMPTGRPYAFLSLIENKRPIQVFGLDEDEITIGRDLTTCDVPIPERFSLVSRVHSRIVRTAAGIFIEDLRSTNGTYVDGIRVIRRKRLPHGASITLGRGRTGVGVCRLDISFQVDNLGELEVTQKLVVPDPSRPLES